MTDTLDLRKECCTLPIVFMAAFSLSLALAVPTSAAPKSDMMDRPAKSGASKGHKLQEGKHEGKEERDEPWYGWFWPLGEKVPVKSLKEDYVPFRTEEHGGGKRPLPRRPDLAVELGDGFLDTGNLGAGFEVPVLGTLWQPRLWAFAVSRTAIQSFDNGFSGQRESEIATRLDLFFNLQLTGTEKLLLGLRPLDQNDSFEFTRYTFDGRDKGFNDNTRLGIETLFFEGDFGSLFHNLDPVGVLPVDFGFTVGRQPFVFQEGILINDTVDAVGVIRNNIQLPGTSNFRVSALWGWNRLDRGDAAGREIDDERDADQNLFGLFASADTNGSTINVDQIYVDDSENGDGYYLGLASIQRLPHLSGISTAFRINTSFALEDEIPGNVVGTGALLSSEISKVVDGSNDIAYWNTALGIDNYTQAGREAIVGGPLANTGISFAGTSLSTFGSALNPFVEDDLIASAIGYQAFYDDGRRNLILELAGRYGLDDVDTFNALALSAQLQQAVGQHVQLTFGTFYVFNENADDGWGARAEVQVLY